MDLAVFLAAMKPEQSPRVLLMKVGRNDYQHEGVVRHACTAFCDRCNSLGWDSLPVWERHLAMVVFIRGAVQGDRRLLGDRNGSLAERVLSAVFYTWMHTQEEADRADGLTRWSYWGHYADARHAGVHSWAKNIQPNTSTESTKQCRKSSHTALSTRQSISPGMKTQTQTTPPTTKHKSG